MSRVAIVEDHGLLAHAVAAALRRQAVEVEVVDAGACEDPVAELTARPASVILLDLDLGDRGDATDLVAPLAATGAHVVILTGVEDAVRRAACIEAGAVGVVSKSVSFDELLAAIDQVLRTGTLFSRHERDEHLSVLRRHRVAEQERLAPFEELSRREAEVLGELMQGHSVEAVAEAAVVSVATVRSQVRAILRKLGVRSQVAAIGLARAAGWEPPQESSSD